MTEFGSLNHSPDKRVLNNLKIKTICLRFWKVVVQRVALMPISMTRKTESVHTQCALCITHIHPVVTESEDGIMLLDDERRLVVDTVQSSRHTCRRHISCVDYVIDMSRRSMRRSAAPMNVCAVVVVPYIILSQARVSVVSIRQTGRTSTVPVCPVGQCNAVPCITSAGRPVGRRPVYRRV